jgi:hypothetical protein
LDSSRKFYAFFNFIGFEQQMRSQASTQPQAVSTDTTIPHTPHVYLLPFGTTGFLAAGLAATLVAGFAAAFVFGAGFFTAGFFAAFASGLLFVAIVLPPFIFFTTLNPYFMHIKYLVKKSFHNLHKKYFPQERGLCCWTGKSSMGKTFIGPKPLQCLEKKYKHFIEIN